MSFNSRLLQLNRSFLKSLQIESQGLSLGQVLPVEILKDPYYHYFKRSKSYSGTIDIPSFLVPKKDKKYLDFGCYLNLKNYRLYRYPWLYYGLETCEEIVKQGNQYIQEKSIKNAMIIHHSSDHIPFKHSYFDCITCIGVFEYYPEKEIGLLLGELVRVLRENGKMILDIPNIHHPSFPLLCKMEDYFGRPVMCRMEFEFFRRILPPCMICRAVDYSEIMVRCYLQKHPDHLK